MIDPATRQAVISTSTPPIDAGKYEVRFAETQAEVRKAQALRYEVMYAEKGGRPDLLKVKERADIDEWDDSAYHVIVVDHSSREVVGTLRLVSSLALAPEQRFYTETTFSLKGLRQEYPVLLELGRFCIHASGRKGTILMLIWKFTMQFIVNNPVDAIIGCASFSGTDISQHSDVMSYLYQNNLAPTHLMPEPIVKHTKLEEIVRQDVDFDKATREVPPLLRGYLKLGAKASDCAIVDPVFNTVFICIYADAKSMLSEDTVLLSSGRR